MLAVAGSKKACRPFNCATTNGDSLLMLASYHRTCRTRCASLLERGADPDLRSGASTTPDAYQRARLPRVS